MTSLLSARDEILSRIRAATRDVPPGERPEDVAVERGYRRSDGASAEERVERFVERIRDYGVRVHRATEDDEVARVVAARCAERGAKRLLIPADLPEAWRPRGPDGGLELVPDRDLSYREIQEADGVLTGCRLAIADTGTIILDAGAGQGRRAVTLLPDFHLCVVRTGQIAGLVPEAIAELAGPGGTATRPLTFISGPSATADIELERVEGVHGPRTLDVILIG